jgi:Rps23 Pro-64 3,4-dihydroxylase Tpa1-like proline 4-hydroxylase
MLGGMRSTFVVDGLLPIGQLRRLLQATVAEERWFVEASTEGRDDYRRAAVLYTIVDEALWVVDRVASWAPLAARALDVELPPQARIEHQITAYREGDRYGVHRDDEGREPAGRALTYVFYFHRSPKAFVGGELVLVDDEGTQHVLPPRNDSVVFFPSSWRHEVRSVSGPVEFADCRFTVNGWLWRG